MPDMVKNDADLKGDMIECYTGDPKKRSTKDLTFDQANELIVRLGGQRWAFEAEPGDRDYAKFDNANKQHRLLLSYCHQLNWVVSAPLNKRGMYADLGRLGSWLRKYGYLKKPLHEYTAAELPKLCTQLGKVLTGKK
jgi:hypothetical protein